MRSDRRRRKQLFISGFCSYSPVHENCRGEFKNGDLAKRKTTLCSCTCHGDYEARMISAGYTQIEEEEEDLEEVELDTEAADA